MFCAGEQVGCCLFLLLLLVFLPHQVKVSEDGSMLSKAGSMCGAAVVRKCLESTVLMSTSSHLLPSPSERNYSLTAQLSPDVFCVGEKLPKAIYGQSDTI